MFYVRFFLEHMIRLTRSKIIFLSGNVGSVSDEQGERFHQDLMTVEERYQGRWDRHMLADYCWSIKRDCTERVYKRKSYKHKFLP